MKENKDEGRRDRIENKKEKKDQRLRG